MKSMTTSVSKGKQSESSDEHNNRKTNLEKASEKKKDAFYTKTGHKHIHREYTYLNDDLLIRKPSEAYDEIFEDSIKEYNDSKTRNDRKIGKGKALTRAEKTAQLQAWTMVHDMRKLSKKNQRLALAKFAKSYPMASKALQDLVERTDNMALKDIRKQVTRAKHAKTLGQAYYEKQKHSKQQRTAVEFVIQVGSAEDFNEIDKNGRIIKSYDRTDPNGIWQRSKKVLKDYYKEFKKNNPNLVPINASIHMDESTPHLHLKVIPVADRDQMQMRGHGTIDKKTGKITKKARHTGLSKKVSFNGALECEGFKRDSSDNRSQFKNWQHREAETLAKIMQNELGVERKKGITNKLKDVHEYKQVKELEAQEHEKFVKQQKTYTETLNKQNVQIQSNHAILQNQTKTLAENQNKLDDLANYESLVSTYQTIANNAKQEQKDAEANRDKALQAQKEAEKAKKLAEEQARNANQMLINSLNARKRDLVDRENGYKDSKGIYHKGIKDREKDVISRESNVINRETAVTGKENNLANYDSQIKEKKTILADYEKNLEAKKQKILDKKNKELQESYKAKKQKLDNAYNSRKDEFVSDLKSLQRQKKQLAESNETQSKFVTYASFVYHKCAETFIKTIDPETNKIYNNGFRDSKHTMAYDMAHGNYHDAMNPDFSGKNGLENCIQEYHINDNRKRLWSALKATGRKFASLINTKQVKTLIRQLDDIDNTGISEEAVKQADNAEIKRQQEFWKQQEQEKQQQRKQKLHIGLRPVAKNDDLENPYDN